MTYRTVISAFITVAAAVLWPPLAVLVGFVTVVATLLTVTLGGTTANSPSA